MVTIKWTGGQLDLDASPSQTHSREADVTEHPVEKGATVTDHVRQKPRVLKIEGVAEAAHEAYDTLNRLMDTTTILVVRTARETYSGMVLSSLTVPHDGNSGDSLRFSATFRRIVFAESKRVEITVPKAKVKRGKQSSKDTLKTAPATASKVEIPAISVPKRVANWVASLVPGGG